MPADRLSQGAQGGGFTSTRSGNVPRLEPGDVAWDGPGGEVIVVKPELLDVYIEMHPPGDLEEAGLVEISLRDALSELGPKVPQGGVIERAAEILRGRLAFGEFVKSGGLARLQGRYERMSPPAQLEMLGRMMTRFRIWPRASLRRPEASTRRPASAPRRQRGRRGPVRARASARPRRSSDDPEPPPLGRAA